MISRLYNKYKQFFGFFISPKNNGTINLSSSVLAIYFERKIRELKEFSIKSFLYKYVYRYIHGTDSGQRPFVIIPAILFSLFMVLGYSYSETNSWFLVFGAGSVQLIKACLKFAVYFVLFYYVISLLYYKFDAISLAGSSNEAVRENAGENSKKHLFGGYINLLSRCPFRTTFLTLFVIYIPYIIVSYPGIFMPDTMVQIIQTYPQLGLVAPGYLRGHLLSDQVFLNTHHSIVHTLLMRAFLQIGTGIFHSFNVGVFLYALFQFFFVLFAISYGIKILVEKTAFPDRYVPLVILYYIISPRIQNYMFLLTKDVIYAAFMLYFILFLYLILTRPERRYFILFAVSGLGMILFRNEAKYILVISLPVLALLCRRLRKFFLKYLIAVIGFSILFFNVLLPICRVNPGSIREMLSVPFQQTARYIREYEADVTAEEREAIDAVLKYDYLGPYYYPDMSDVIKGTYREDCTKDDLFRYFKVWFQMFWKHPDSYIQATINNYYYYFYPGPILFSPYEYGLSAQCIEVLNQMMEPLGSDFHHPLYNAADQYETLRETLMYIPPIVLLMYSPTYTWFLMLFMLYGIYKKMPQALSLLIVPVIVLCVCLVSPCNGYHFRYLYPIVFVLPILIPLYFSMKHIAQLN